MKNAVDFYADFSGVTDFVGASLALTDALKKNSPYLDAIMESAFNKADDAFNTEAAAAASAGADIKHMFEWGTVGVNRGRSNMRPTPNSERARLWHTEMSGRGGSQLLTYAFKPSVASVPKPTTRDSGMDSQIIAEMKSHVFMWKSRVMELGEWVTIAKKDAQFLLMPHYEGATGFRPNDVKRGYMLLERPVMAQPGRNVQGNFTSYWVQFWESRGTEMIQEALDKQIQLDFMPEVVNNTAGAPRPVKTINVPAAVQTEKAKVAKKTTTKAKARRTQK